MKFDSSGYEKQSGKVTAVLLVLAAAFWYAATGGYTLGARVVYTIAFAVAGPLLASDIDALRTWIRD